MTEPNDALRRALDAIERLTDAEDEDREHNPSDVIELTTMFETIHYRARRGDLPDAWKPTTSTPKPKKKAAR